MEHRQEVLHIDVRQEGKEGGEEVLSCEVHHGPTTHVPNQQMLTV